MDKQAPDLVRVATRVPVMSGDIFNDGDGLSHTIDTATVVLRSPDGLERTIVLQRGTDGRWWFAGDDAAAPLDGSQRRDA